MRIFELGSWAWMRIRVRWISRGLGGERECNKDGQEESKRQCCNEAILA